MDEAAKLFAAEAVRLFSDGTRDHLECVERTTLAWSIIKRVEAETGAASDPEQDESWRQHAVSHVLEIRKAAGLLLIALEVEPADVGGPGAMN